jgi:diketogulonate reductase-like aldo/keto reductase
MCITETLPKHIMPCGLEVAPIGLGSYDDRKKNEFQKITQFLNGIEQGYRLIDTAYEYENEKHLGLAIKQLIAQKVITRSDLFVTTKVWNTFHTRERALENVKYELRDLGLDYSDLGLLHFPTSVVPGKDGYPREYYTLTANGSVQAPYAKKDYGYVEAWKGLEAAQRLGLVRHLGLANFNIHQIKKILSLAVVKPVVIQV